MWGTAAHRLSQASWHGSGILPVRPFDANLRDQICLNAYTTLGEEGGYGGQNGPSFPPLANDNA